MSERIRLRAGQTAVIGYGSLLSRASIGRTLGRDYDGPFAACELEGWRRTWDASMPNEAFYFLDGEARVYPRRILYLNVRPARGERLNTIVFVLNDSELEAMHGREWIYAPTAVNEALRGVEVEGGAAIVYTAHDEHVLRDIADRRDAAIRASYLRILDVALGCVPPEFRAEYERSTETLPRHLVVDDELDPDRPSPWAERGAGYRPQSYLDL